MAEDDKILITTVEVAGYPEPVSDMNELYFENASGCGFYMEEYGGVEKLFWPWHRIGQIYTSYHNVSEYEEAKRRTDHLRNAPNN